VIDSKDNKTWWKPNDVNYEDFSIKKEEIKSQEETKPFKM
jgi:hypothetical protein